MNYLHSLAVDTATGVISYVQADFADSRDTLLDRAFIRAVAVLLYPLRSLILDTGSSNTILE
jgi:hypothetical protein